MKTLVSVIILTYNEEANIEHCLESVCDFADEILIIDSNSTDRTLEIAEKYGAKIHKHAFVNQADQFNWALDNIEIKNEWIFRLDADEWVTKELWEEIEKKLPRVPKDVNGFYINRKVYFMGRWIRHGSYYPNWILRFFRYGKGRSEERKMDEHLILLGGRSDKFKNHIVDDNKKDLTWWTNKQNNYTSREAEQALEGGKEYRGIGGQAAKKRWIKQNVYYRLPPFFRAFIYFIYRYVIRLGFLDGKEGLIFHFLQGFWYRFLVDAKLYEREHKK